MTARLVPLSEGSVAVVLDKAITLIGRHPDCDAVLDENQKISRRHCCIAQVDNRLILRDLGSMNGVRVNGEPIVEIDLREGDEITIGDEEFVLELKSKSGLNKKPIALDQATPEKPKRTPRPVAAPAPPVQRRPLPPEDLSLEFPVPIPDELEEEDLHPSPRGRAARSKPKPDDESPQESNRPAEDPGVFKFDSGGFDLGNFRDL